MATGQTRSANIRLVSSSIDCYDADKDLNVIRKWYEMIVAIPLVEDLSLKQLENEAKDTEDKPNSRMQYYLQRAKKSKKSVPGLWKAEIVAVLMYTDDDDVSAFFREYNKASSAGTWEPYKFYTAFLTSAVRKLAINDPIHEDVYLYRGFRSKLDPPKAKRIFWKAFTSTTLSYAVAEDVFAGDDGIVYEFQPPAADQRASRCAAKVKNLSNHPDEEEVILLPFEAFDVVSPAGEQGHFQTSQTQELLN